MRRISISEAFAKRVHSSLHNRRRATVPTHCREVERALGVCRWFRQTQRPAAAIRRLGVTSGHGAVPLGLGGQLIRWPKADLLAIALRDYLSVVDEFWGHGGESR